MLTVDSPEVAIVLPEAREEQVVTSRLYRWLTLEALDSKLALAQLSELQKQIPLLYALLSVNAIALAYTHFSVAPAWMTVWVPGILVIASLYRLITWAVRPVEVTESKQAIRVLRRTIILGSALAAAYIWWSLAMNEYGGEREHAHVAIFIAITVIGCIFCLMHLPQAAFAVTGIVTIPYLAFYLSLQDPIYTAIALNIALVTVVIMRVLLNSHHGFQQLIRTQLETERLNREVTALAHTDLVTGLPNRRLFFSQLDSRLAAARDASETLALGVIDLDRFKAANDTYGHLVGDLVLQTVGERLRSLFSADELVTRLGGDEFAFVIRADGKTAVARADMACEALSVPMHVGGHVISVGASCGIATTVEVQGSARSLYDAADYALYAAKTDRRGAAALFSKAHEQRIRLELSLEEALQKADLASEMSVYLQPIVDVRSGRIVCVEALARWTNARLGAVSPDIFIPLAERMGLINQLTLTLLSKTLQCAQLMPAGMNVSFNLSGHDIVNRQTVLAIAAMVRQSGFNPRNLIFELTETAVVRDLEAAEQSMGLLHALGSLIALDDFGTGQSSLGYLHRLPIDKVKLDRSFLAGMSEAQGRKLLSAVVGLCHSIGMTCIAEGVENAEQLALLHEIDCDAYQGYLFARPMSVADLTAFLKNQNRTAASA
jgi:diguanylate cyclase (GGDEF)-like protein